MAVTLGDLQNDLEKLISDQDNLFASAADLTRYINETYEEFCFETNILVKDTSLDYSVKSQLVTLPSDYLDTLVLMYEGKYLLTDEPLNVNPQAYFQGYGATAGIPSGYVVLDNHLRLNRAISKIEITTTLNGAITSTTSSITVASVSNFQTAGRVKVESEMIEYATLDTTNVQFQFLSRGAGRTTAASHASGTTVTMKLLRHVYIYSPVRLASSTDAILIPDIFQSALVEGAAYKLSVIKGRTQRATAHLSLFRDWLDRGRRYANKRNSKLIDYVRKYIISQ